ncbi:MAG: serine/threonine protein kinase [Sandaracinaceae bacterium]|nr:serine/threonine protein kinase [Sandaracinaceae bacterium]
MTRASDAPDGGERAARADSGSHTQPGVAKATSPLVCILCDRQNPPDSRFCAGCGHRFGADAFDDEGGADPLLGRVIADRYRMEELLGRGGMGVVYRVEHVNIGKLMAMKLLHGALARDKETVKRFKREAELVSRLDHPNTVQVFDFGQSEGMMYLVMEYLPGRDLGQALKETGPLSFARVARIGVQVCGSVGQAHELGVVHRDLKPENVMLIEGSAMSDFVKVLDFGLAKLREHEEMGGQSITRQGAILGTPYYMAPEHIRGEPVDQRSDVYALGALMYKALTGVPPFWATTPVGVLTMHLTDEVEPPSERAPERGIPKEADEILLRAMRKNPADRYQTMRGLRDALFEYLEAIGEDAGLESLRLGTSVGLAAGAARQQQLATRVDVDAFEARLRRRSVLGVMLGVLALAALAVGAAYLWRNPPELHVGTEQEPNDEISQANLLPEGATLRAYLGRRIDASRSDADLFELRNPGGGRRVVRIDVGAIPNMDVMFELYREGITSPLLVADSAGIGGAESVPNFVIDGPTYYLRVRELWEAGRLPSENVSDPYTVRWRVVEPEADDEREVNDSVERAGTIAPGGSVRGFVGWAGDADVFCLEGEAERVVARLGAVPTLDLVLRRIDRTTGRATAFDEEGLGGGEATDVLERAEAGRYCFEVSARRPKVGAGNDPEHRYELRVERGVEPS